LSIKAFIDIYINKSLYKMNDDHKMHHNTLWNDSLEYAVKEIGESSKGYKLMHIAQAQVSNTTYNRLMILGICLGPLSGIVSGLRSDIHPGLSILSTGLGFLGGIVVAIIRFGKYEEYSNANKQAAARYTSIESNVRRQLGLYRTDRVTPALYVEWLETKYEELFLSAPLLPTSAYDKYTIIANKLGLQVPNHYESVIMINDKYDDEKVNEIINERAIDINSANIDNSDNITDFEDVDIDVEMGIKNSEIVRGIKRSNTMSQFSSLNECSDKMLQYEMKRMMGF
jgi:hypothetical protein